MRAPKVHLCGLRVHLRGLGVHNPCDHEAPDGVTCKMGLEELCKGTFSLWAMYATRLGQPPDTNMTCCTASVFSSECTSVWCVFLPLPRAPVLRRPETTMMIRGCSRGMMQLLRVCPMFRNMKNNLPEGTDTDPSIAHELCDTCLYESPGDINSVE